MTTGPCARPDNYYHKFLLNHMVLYLVVFKQESRSCTDLLICLWFGEYFAFTKITNRFIKLVKGFPRNLMDQFSLPFSLEDKIYSRYILTNKFKALFSLRVI